MGDDALRALMDSAPITGPIIVLQFIAIAWLARELRAAMHARVDDAKATTTTLLQVGASTTQAMGGLRTAIDSLKQSDVRTREVVTQVRDQLQRRNR